MMVSMKKYRCYVCNFETGSRRKMREHVKREHWERKPSELGSYKDPLSDYYQSIPGGD